eukprot:1385482-Amphidinium_carterae.1
MDVSAEQLSGLKAIIDACQDPFVDFAVFKPNCHTHLKRVNLGGMQFDGDCRWRAVDMKGAGTYHELEQCYHVLRTVLVMLDCVSLGALEVYKDLVKEFGGRFSPVCWHLIYQTDYQCRLEHMEMERRAMDEKAARAAGLGGMLEYDPSFPWNYIWTEVAPRMPSGGTKNWRCRVCYPSQKQIH